MGTKYAAVSVSGYNATPPADDGTVSEANKVKWSTIKTKLPDPLKTALELIDSELQTHFDHGPTALTSNTTLGASHYEKFVQVSGSGVTLTLSDAATLGAGWNLRIVSTDTSNSVTIGRATGGDTINGSASNFTLNPSQGIDVFVNAAANGFIVRSIVIDPVTVDTTQTITGAKTLQSTDAGASAGPTLTLDRNSATPANSDVLGAIAFKGRDSGAGTDTFAQIQAEITDVTATSEDGRLAFQTPVNGTLASRLYLGAGLFTAGGSDQGANTIQASGGLYDGSFRVGMVKLTSGSTSGSSLDITLGSFTAFKHKLFILTLLPVTDDVDLYMRVSTNGGSSYDAGASDYKWGYSGVLTGTGDVSSSDNADTQLVLNHVAGGAGTHIGNGSGEYIHCRVYLNDTTSSAVYNTMKFQTTYTSAGSEFAMVDGGGMRVALQDTDAVRFLFSSGNISGGNYEVYGWN